jgi:hypothetical protein
MRRFGTIVIAVLALVAVGLVVAGYRLYDYTENDARFCGSCHIMGTAFKTWSEGPHKGVNCHVCHQQNIQDRVRIVWSWATSRVEKVPPHTQLARSVCESCHLNDQVKWKQIAKTAGHAVHVTRANLQCLSCHLPSLHSVKPKTEDCVKCHNQARTNIGGMAGFHCTACHQFLVGKDAGLEPKRETCLGCHSAMKLKGETFPDGAPMKFECAACHKPHSQPILKFNDCLGCHPQVAGDRKHFERDLTKCVSCHRPHVWKARAGTAGKEN